ncbi:MAG: Ig-like domain-containing protein [Thermoanaerobaculaceae bacterium]|nr:Ig-like domain-containing protein [Thermoanaerobaculaceae bacterium]
MPRRALAALLVVGQLTLLLSGCMSVQATGTHPAQGPGGGVAVRVFPDDGAWRAGRPGPDGIEGELERRSGDGWVPVFRSLNPAWTVAGLPPGEYRVRFPARLDEAGNVVRLSGKATTVQVRDGAVTDVRAVLDHVSTGLIVLGVVTVVAIAVILTKESRDHGLPLPPPPPPELLDAVFYVSVNLAAGSGWESAERSLPPAVTSHFPAAGAIVAARRPRLVFSLSEPLRPTSLHADAVTVLGEASGLVPGQVSYDAANWWVVWQPAVDLAAGDTFHVTLARDGAEDAAGHELAAPASFTFRTAP